MSHQDFKVLTWPLSKLSEAFHALVRESRIVSDTTAAQGSAPPVGEIDIALWLEWEAVRGGLEVEPLETTLGNLETALQGLGSAILRVSNELFVAIIYSDSRKVELLAPNLGRRHIPLKDLCDLVREPVERPKRVELEKLLCGAELPARRRAKVISLLLKEQFASGRFDQCWQLRGSPAEKPLRWLRQANAIGNGAGLLAAHMSQYLLWLASWAILGNLSFSGHMDRGWLIAWALLLMTMLPLRVLTTWLQGLLAVGVGAILKRRLLLGALKLEPDEIRHRSIGSFLGQALEAEAIESAALSGGVAGLLAAVEIAVSAFILGRFAILLAFWFGLTVFLGVRFFRAYRHATKTRMEMTQELVESMVGHRTRLAQQQPEKWHESEDHALDAYFTLSRSVDRSGSFLIAGMPRGWVIAALVCLAPALIQGQSSDTQTAVVLGGILLAYSAFRRISESFADLAATSVAAEQIAPLFHAAARDEICGEILVNKASEQSAKVVEADRLTYRYRREGQPALQACSLTVRRGERVLLEGPSGGGKTTFASLLSGMRQPESGLLLANGLDRHTVGANRWRERVAAAPQFHENHILTETLAFNLLMGRQWPPTAKDMQDAEAICRDLGLSELLDRMPSGILQMVGEGGWQLSHGERSRIFIARALLQRADLVILDESFAALDPENLKIALECTLRRAETLMVIAHP